MISVFVHVKQPPDASAIHGERGVYLGESVTIAKGEKGDATLFFASLKDLDEFVESLRTYVEDRTRAEANDWETVGSFKSNA